MSWASPRSTCKRIPKGRCAVHEILVTHEALPNTIRSGQIANIKGIIESGGADGMITMDNSLMARVKDGTVEPKLLHRCNLPLTGAGVVDMVITDLGVFTIDKHGTGDDTEDNAWFVGFAPYRNPEIVVGVFVEHGGHGGVVGG